MSVVDVHRAHGDFVWACLQRIGARQPDLDDLFQEVFVVLQRKLPSFRADAPMRPWLHGICVRVVSTYKRRSFRWRERPVAEPSQQLTSEEQPDATLIATQARARLDRVLDSLDIDKRVVFVMFEIDELPCAVIAKELGIPLGTVHSRLHGARADFKKAVSRLKMREET